MNQSEHLNELAVALCKLQGMVTSIPKNKIAKGLKFSYSYADLAGIWDAIRAPLASCGLSVVQSFDNNAMVTLLMHSSGQWVRSVLPMTSANVKPQELGSEITYLRRYGLSAILGLTTDDDDDGELAQKAKENASQAKQLPMTQKNVPESKQISEIESILAKLPENIQDGFWEYLGKAEGKEVTSLHCVAGDKLPFLKNALLKKLDVLEEAIA